MIQSMTAFASRTGAMNSASWAWEMRGVNARGLDLRLRIADGLDGLEQAVRAALTARFSRGNISLTLRLQRDDSAGALILDADQLDRVLAALDQIQERAFEKGVTLAQATSADVLQQKGVVVQGRTDDDTEALVAALITDLGPLLDDFAAMRRNEGGALRSVLLEHLDQIAELTDAAAVAAEARLEETRANMAAALRRVLDEAVEAEPARIAQELAIIAVKQDVTEEINRLKVHIGAAKALLDDPKPAGRKLDFLAQEFNREANTLCSAIGLDLKAVIDQMREQIQNVE
ncbi:MAG: YicC family protein [Rhodobacteraceae bacterium]|nr:YicC family protein [Paracoccaceae bacterium]